MKSAPFKYVAASSLDHALSLKFEYGDDARFLARGQSLIPTMNFRLARPSVLIDINGLKDLAGVDRSDPAHIRVGALTRYRDLERDSDFLRCCPLFADALPHIAHPQIRNRSTIGGNLSHADPASELPALAVAIRGAVAGLVGDSRIFVSGGAEHQGPDGGGLIAVIASRNGGRI
jgi:CO/xanthine dehydrogenase FAD-binding subunit